jgi:hypothetical protein
LLPGWWISPFLQVVHRQSHILDFEFVDVDAKGRDLHRIRKRLLRIFKDLNYGLLARFVRRIHTGRCNLPQLAWPTQLDPCNPGRKLVALFRGVDRGNPYATSNS